MLFQDGRISDASLANSGIEPLFSGLQYDSRPAKPRASNHTKDRLPEKLPKPTYGRAFYYGG